MTPSSPNKTTGLTIQEAIRSGKLLKRENDTENDWMEVHPNGYFQYTSVFREGIEPTIMVRDILAEDWMVK